MWWYHILKIHHILYPSWAVDNDQDTSLQWFLLNTKNLRFKWNKQTTPNQEIFTPINMEQYKQPSKIAGRSMANDNFHSWTQIEVARALTALRSQRCHPCLRSNRQYQAATATTLHCNHRERLPVAVVASRRRLLWGDECWPKTIRRTKTKEFRPTTLRSTARVGVGTFGPRSVNKIEMVISIQVLITPNWLIPLTAASNRHKSNGSLRWRGTARKNSPFISIICLRENTNFGPPRALLLFRRCWWRWIIVFFSVSWWRKEPPFSSWWRDRSLGVCTRKVS